MNRDDSASPFGPATPDTPRNFMRENREASETPAAQPGSGSAGEGKSHTARVYVSEESHCGIVPRNHSNKDMSSSAESEEGSSPDHSGNIPRRRIASSGVCERPEKDKKREPVLVANLGCS
jgi:hypothetical protein